MSVKVQAVGPLVGTVFVSPAKALWLWLNVVPAFGALFLVRHPLEIAAALGLTFVTLCLGHSVGLHRGLIHETFKTRRGFERILVSLFVLTGLGGPLSWIRLHRVRDYWQNQRSCPPYFAYRHGLVRDFYWNLHCSFTPVSWDRYALLDKLTEDRFLRALERTWWIWNLLFFAILALALGWRSALILGPARVAASILGHWFIGFRTHTHGDRPYTLEGASEHGTNSVALGWISFGEGFHNNHHAFPDSARMGHRWWELDVGWLTIRLFEVLGLVSDVKTWSRLDAVRRPAAYARVSPDISGGPTLPGIHGDAEPSSMSVTFGVSGARPGGYNQLPVTSRSTEPG